MQFKFIDLIVIGDFYCPSTYFYLEYLYRNNFKPKKIFLCKFFNPISFSNKKEKLIYLVHKDLYKFFFSPVSESFSPLVHELQIHFQKFFSFQTSLKESQNVDYKKYSNVIEILKIWDYKDKKLKKAVFNDKKYHFLYTNGGIVPKEYFENEVKILHVHPGIVPQVRGSDGFLWSLLTRSKLGYSCFYMNSGIDTGSLIYQEEFNFHAFPEIKPLIENNHLEAYKALLLGYDLHLRGQVLTKVLKEVNGDVACLTKTNQTLINGSEFYSMHPRLVKRILQEFLG